MKKVLFIAKYSHDLTYFKKIQNYFLETEKDIKTDVILNIPIFIFSLLSLFKKTPMTKLEQKEVLEYELARKKAKYSAFKFQLFTIILTFTAKLYYFKYNSVIKMDKYDAICLWGGFHIMQKVVSIIAKHNNIKVYYFENGLLPNTTVMDIKGTNFNNSVPRTEDFYQSINIKFTQIPFVERKNLQNSNTQKELPKNYIFCPFQDWLDTQILIHSPLVKNMEEFYAIIQELAQKLPNDVYFVIKKHPNCKKSYSHLEEKNNPQIIFANENKTAELIQNAKAILTINSTVGMEGLMFHKKVITLGNAFFDGIGIAKHTTDADELLDIIANLDKWEINLDLLDKFLSYLQNYYLLPQGYQVAGKEHFEAIYKKF